MKKTDGSGIGGLRFLNLLFELQISSHRDEKLSIKVNYTTPPAKPETEFVVLSRFGFVQNVLTNTESVLLAQKIRAIIQRKDAQPRDFYDAVWFFSRNVSPDAKVLRGLNIKTEKDVFAKLHEVFEGQIKPRLPEFKKRLRPFLIDESRVSHLDMFGGIMKKLK